MRASCVACLAALVGWAWWTLSIVRSSPNHRTLAGLVSVLPQVRITEGRLTGGMPFTPIATSTPTRGAVRELSPDVRIAIATLEKAAFSPTSTATDLHALAIGRAVEHRLTDAAAMLRRLTTATSGADVWSDLAAVQLAVGEPQDIAAAVGSAEQALRHASRHPEALFNRALAIERLGLPTQAVVAWRRYLDVDARSLWAEEALTHVARLEAASSVTAPNVRASLLAAIDANESSRIDRLVADTPQEMRDALEDELFGRWAIRAASTHARRAPGADAMEAATSALSRRTGDTLLEESVRSFLAAGPEARRSLASAHAQYSEARVLYDRYAFADALRLFKQAGEVMKRHDDPFWRWCEFHTWAIVYQQNDLRTAFDALRRLHARSARYGALGARIQWLLGIIAASWSLFDDAFRHYRGALAYYQQAGERDNVAAINSLLADTYLLLGAERQAWASQFEALSVDFRRLRARRQQLVAFTGMQAAARTGSPEAALQFNAAFIEAAERAGNTSAVAEGQVHRARLYHRLNECAQAATSLHDAAARLASAEASGVVEFIRAQMLLEEAGHRACGTSLDRIASLSAAIDIFRRSTRAVWLPRALLARARELRRHGRATAAEQDLEEGITLLDRSAATVGSAALRIEYTDDVWEIFDEMIDLQLAADRPHVAWAFSERGRLQALKVTKPAAVSASDLAARLPIGHTLLYYAYTDARVLLFTFSRGQFELRRLTTAAAALGDRIRRFTTRLEAGLDDEETRGLAEQLYADLLDRAVAPLADGTRLYIVADGPLHQLPFQALKARGDARFMFERFPMSSVSSATALFSPRQQSSARTTSALVFGDPWGDDFGQTLPRLPNAAREAATVAALYDRAELYVREHATRDVFLKGIARADVVHFAGHAVVDERRPDLSRLILAHRTPGEPRPVLMRELVDVALPRTELVVLAACSTGAGPVFRGQGSLSLAWPFVAAGVPTVVSTLWPIDDFAGNTLFVLFHKQFAAGVDPVEALRRAQKEVSRDPTLKPWTWAAVSMFTTLDSRNPSQAREERER